MKNKTKHKTKILFKNGLRIWIGISPKKYKWPTDTWKGADTSNYQGYENQVNNEILLYRILIKIALIKKQKVEKCLQGCEEIAAAGRGYHRSEVRGGSWEELPHVPGLGRWLGWATTTPPTPPPEARGSSRGGAIPHSRPGAAAQRSNSTPKGLWLHGCRRAKRSHSNFKVRRSGGEEILLVQG